MADVEPHGHPYTQKIRMVQRTQSLPSLISQPNAFSAEFPYPERRHLVGTHTCLVRHDAPSPAAETLSNPIPRVCSGASSGWTAEDAPQRRQHFLHSPNDNERPRHFYMCCSQQEGTAGRPVSRTTPPGLYSDPRNAFLCFPSKFQISGGQWL